MGLNHSVGLEAWSFSPAFGARPVRAAALLLLLVVTAGCAHPAAGGAQGRAWDWLLGQRDAEGRWSATLTPYVVEAAVAAGKDPSAWPSPVPLAQQVPWPADGATYMSALRPLHGWALLPDHGGRGADIERRLLAGYDGRQFGNPALLNDDAFALMTLAALDPAKASGRAASLAANQSADGGWSWAPGGEPETDMTGIILSVLSDAGAGGFDANAARAFLDGTHVAGGGHAQHTGAANCDSTVWAMRGYRALGVPAPSDDQAFLESLQRGDGSLAYQAGGSANALCTVEAAAELPR
jgi:hypothetical protein